MVKRKQVSFAESEMGNQKIPILLCHLTNCTFCMSVETCGCFYIPFAHTKSLLLLGSETSIFTTLFIAN